jgi:hypothetical protein
MLLARPRLRTAFSCTAASTRVATQVRKPQCTVMPRPCRGAQTLVASTAACLRRLAATKPCERGLLVR